MSRVDQSVRASGGDRLTASAPHRDDVAGPEHPRCPAVRYTQIAGKPIGSPGATVEPVVRHLSRSRVRSIASEPVEGWGVTTGSAVTGAAEAIAGEKPTDNVTPTATIIFDAIRGIAPPFER
ncbi:hypothetical protein IU449_16185 [Nocardia higoensis]|uniref:Uncharacterized protein n=1 Tax=Nocardia higoensis TaxID=228599 RepID=A0ABS0DC61_9NOCA|nr:hypothetical protein [Nocardia higoensis]